MIEVSPAVRGLIFDCDGTLVDSMPLHLESWEKAFSAAGEPFQRDFLDSLKGMEEEGIIRSYNRRYDRDLDPRLMVERKHAHFQKHASRVEPIPPVVELAKEKHGLLPMAVVSGGKRKNVDLVLAGLGIESLFDVILTADDPFPPKPAPDLFLEAARRLDVAPDLCHVFEDGDLGLQAARRAGMTATDVRLYL